MVTRLNYRELLQSIDGDGQTPIHYAAGVDNEVLKVFLQSEAPELGTTVNMKDNQGRTAAHIAVQQNNVDGLKLLMEHFPDICEMTDNQGRNIVHYSAILGHFEALDYFLSEIQFSDLVNKKDEQKDTPLHLLVKSLEERPISSSSLERLRSLIPKLSKLQVMSYNGEGKTPGDIASSIDFSNLKHTVLPSKAQTMDALREIRMMAPKGGRGKQWIPPLQEYKKDIEAHPGGYASNDLGTAAGSHMVVAALIATVSFTAGLTVPGGFIPESKKEIGEKLGTANLSHSKAFQAFLLTDGFVFFFSLAAILCYFWFVVFTGKKRRYLFTCALRATSISVFMLMVAFITGTLSFFNPSKKIIVIALVLSLPVIISILITFIISEFVVSIPGLQLRWPNKKLKWRVVHGHVTDNPTILAASSTFLNWLTYAVITLIIIVAGFVILYLCKVLEWSE